MEYIVMDLEWNRATVGRKNIKGLPGEIIQIGAAKVDGNMNIIDTYTSYVKPYYYHKMNQEVRELTGITEEDLKDGKCFAEAIEEFKGWCGGDCCFVTWGGSDLSILRKNLAIHSQDAEWLPKTYDAQLIFDDMYTQENRNFALNYALYYFDEKPAGLHSADADVVNTVRVMKHMDMDEAFEDEYYLC